MAKQRETVGGTGGVESGAGAAVFRVPRASTVDLIAIELRNAIYSGALAVGRPIGEVEISSQLGVSRGPLREATQRLVQEGLLTATPGRGLRVSIIDGRHVQDVYDARLAVEGQAVRVILRDGSEAAAAAELETALAALERASEGDDARAIGDADLAFHRTLVEAAGSRRLSRSMSTLAIETRIATFCAPGGYSVRSDIAPSYRALIDALRAGSADRAIAALEEQFDEAVLRLRGELPEGISVETVAEPRAAEPPALGPIFAPGD